VVAGEKLAYGYRRVAGPDQGSASDARGRATGARASSASTKKETVGAAPNQQGPIPLRASPRLRRVGQYHTSSQILQSSPHLRQRTQALISAAGSTGWRNTCAKFTRRSLKAQSFSRTLI
jgi:hypothetical protein